MDSTIIAQPSQQLRDALVAYYLGQLVPHKDSAAPDFLITPEDLYEYLLIDNQVSAEVDTSRVAQGIASVQQHIHAIYNGMEPGFGQIADTAQHQQSMHSWHEAMSQYSNWAGYQMLVDYPENYLDPSLRLGKTEAFKAFESELAQSRLTPDSVQKALGKYLTSFEEVSNLDTVCCYIDGENFYRADYYFIGRSNTTPPTYYWRKAALDLDESSTHVAPSAWTQWKQVDMPATGTVTHVRAAVVEGRLHVVWLEQVREALDADDKPIDDKFVYRLNVSYLQSDGQWSAAILLEEKVMASFETLERAQHVLVAALDSRNAAEPRLVAVFMKRTDTNVGQYAMRQIRSRHWKTLYLGDGQASFERSLVFMMKGGPGGAQFPITGADTSGRVWDIDSIKWNPAGENQEGALSRHLELEAGLNIVVDKLTMNCTTVCRIPWYSSTEPVNAPATGKVGIWRGTPRAEYPLTFNGAARSPIVPIAWVQSTVQDVDYLRIGNPDASAKIGYSEFTIVRKQRAPDTIPVFVKTDQGGLFLDLKGLKLAKLQYIRLNTTFAGDLVRSAERSLEGVLGWETQHTPEPPIPDSTTPVPVDFNGANGRYFWEIFFHVPHLAAWRLFQAFDHAGAEQWLHYLFNPQVRVAPLYPPPDEVQWQPYWTSRPLAFPDDPLRDVAAPRDPDAIAYGAPSHYRKAIFMLYLDNLIAWGDTLYRQVTRDTLNEAKLLYVRALSLLGPLSKGRSISQWTPISLEEAARYDSDRFTAYEASAFAWLAQDTPRRADEAPWLNLIDAPWFRLPVNTRLLDLWDQLDERLSNLRNNLTLNGQPLSLALYEAPANPLDLLRAQLAGSATSLRRLGGQDSVPPYRFATMLPRARDAVESLIRFGDQVRQAMESQERADQEVLSQSHMVELAAFVEQLDALAIEQASKALEVASANSAQIQAQIDHYDQLLARDVSDAERSAEGLFVGVTATRILAAGFRGTGHALGVEPNTVTFAPGPVPVPVLCGWNWSGPFWTMASLYEAMGTFHSDSAERALRADAHARRRDEWGMLKTQAQHQLESVQRQIEQHQMLIKTAQTKRERSLKMREQAQTLYAFIQNRATNGALYRWLLGQMSTLYFQAYDGVLSLCLATEATWQYEIGDPQTTFIPFNAWVDNRQGLTAGESLSLGLLQMESAYLLRNERRLALVKTVSLRRLLQDYQGEDGDTGWAAVIATLRGSGAIEFQLKPSLFDQDYPGHYLRQIAQVSVSLPGVLGPYENARAMLTQTRSSYLIKPDLGSSKHMYQQAGELDDGHDDVNSTYVIANPRISQQVAISGDLEDTGLSGMGQGDERYMPFEGTGAVSGWTLAFPRHASAAQQSLLEGLQDIVVHVRYYAVDGGKPFAQQIKGLIPGRRQQLRPRALPAS